MSTKDMYNDHSVASSLVPAVRTTSGNGTGVSVGDKYEGALCQFSVGAFGDALPSTSSGATACYITPTLQESDDNSTYTDVAAADIIGSLPGNLASSSLGGAGGASATYTVGYRGSKRYLRWKDARTGTQSTGTPTSALITRGYPRQAPVSQGT